MTGDDVDEQPSGDDPAEDPRIRSARQRLDRLDDLPVEEHVAVYDAAHRDLAEALAHAAEVPEVPEVPDHEVPDDEGADRRGTAPA